MTALGIRNRNDPLGHPVHCCAGAGLFYIDIASPITESQLALVGMPQLICQTPAHHINTSLKGQIKVGGNWYVLGDYF